ncbi:MAG: hypothetical protein IKQ24_01510 [Verrucomicrobia bacterium]|jgi:hypothetical protein|nr:hypothetical protein [Verrucomicrobiota bacterium]
MNNDDVEPPKWLRNVIGVIVAFMGLGELDDKLGQKITDKLYGMLTFFWSRKKK